MPPELPLECQALSLVFRVESDELRTMVADVPPLRLSALPFPLGSEATEVRLSAPAAAPGPESLSRDAPRAPALQPHATLALAHDNARR